MSVRAFRRRVERAVCAVVGIDDADLWNPRLTRQSVFVSRGLVVYTMTKALPVTAADLAEVVGVGEPALSRARGRVASAAFADPAIRRALFDIAARAGVDSGILLPKPVTAVPVASARRERVPA